MTKGESKSSACLMDSEVIRRIRQHARAHMRTEVCGVLIGNNRGGTLCVDECIQGLNAAQAGSHVTFTQDTWEHVYRIKDKDFPDARIVGWYHSHPGFGVFLSEHDIFIHKNFFTSRDQIAWVYDPHSDEEGCFGWVQDRIERIPSFRISDQRGGEPAEGSAKHDPSILDSGVSEEFRPIRDRVESPDSPAWQRWTITILTHLLVLCIGFFIAWYIFPRLVVVGVPVDPQTGRPIIKSTPLESGAIGNRSDLLPPKDDINKGNLQEEPSVPKPDRAKANDAHTR